MDGGTPDRIANSATMPTVTLIIARAPVGSNVCSSLERSADNGAAQPKRVRRG